MRNELSPSIITSQIDKLRSMNSVSDLNKIQEYNKFLDNFPDVDEILEDIQSELSTLTKVKKKLKWDIRGAEYDLKVSQRKYNKTEGLSGLRYSLTSKGKEDREAYRLKYERNQDIHTALRDEDEALSREIEEMKEKYQAWKRVNRDFKKIVGWRQNLLENLLEGKEVPGTQELEREISELDLRLREISNQMFYIQRSRKSLLTAKKALDDNISDIRRSVRMLRSLNIVEFMTSNDGILDNIGMSLHGRSINKSIASMQSRMQVLRKENEGKYGRLSDLRTRYIELLDQRKTKQSELNERRLEYLQKSQMT